MKKQKKIVVVGNGMVGQRFLEQVLEHVPEPFQITVISQEEVPAYNRVLLSPLLAGEISEQHIKMKDKSWYAKNNIKLCLGKAVTRLSKTEKFIALSDGSKLDYDICVFATGSSPVRLPIDGASGCDVKTFRDLTDVVSLKSFADSKRPSIVIGGGLLGLETAYGLSRAGAPVTVLEFAPFLMERQLDEGGGKVLASAIREKGIDLRVTSQAHAVVRNEDTSVKGIELKDGQFVAGNLVVFAVGVTPNIQIAEEAGISCKRGILVNDQLCTSCEDVYAIGECAEHQGTTYGLVSPGYEQASVAAKVIAGKQASYGGSVTTTNLKVSGVSVFSAGDVSSSVEEKLVFQDRANGHYRAVFISNDTVVGVVLIGETRDAAWYEGLIREQRSTTKIRQTLAFGPEFVEAA